MYSFNTLSNINKVKNIGLPLTHGENFVKPSFAYCKMSYMILENYMQYIKDILIKQLIPVILINISII